MSPKVQSEDVIKHSLVVSYKEPIEFDDFITVSFDGHDVATAHFFSEDEIKGYLQDDVYLRGYTFLFLERINLERYNLERQGIGTIIIDYLYEHFEVRRGNKGFLLLVQYDKRNTSKEFYEKIDFKDFQESEEFNQEFKDDVYFLLDPFCEDAQILYK